MSYSKTTDGISKLDIHNIEVPEQNQPVGVEQFCHEHIEVAKRAAAMMALFVGRPSDQVSVTISGHANPHHAPCAGWSDEFMSIHVRVVATK